jgi:predicted ATPase/DNA-binding CsgD family transcriptional regulator
VHTGEVRLRDEGNYIGPAINRTARLRELAHGGQTVLSGTTSDLVADLLPDGVWLNDMGTHPLRDLPRPERVVQLCHPDLRNEFPPLRVKSHPAAQQLPTQLTSFVGRADEMGTIAGLVGASRLVTLTGAGGVGKTRLAVHTVVELAGSYRDGAWYVDLAPITDPEMVPVTVARALGLPDQPGRTTMDTLLGFLRDRQMLIVLDNCEHLLDASARLVGAVLGAVPMVAMLATSREPIGVTGEATFRVPSLSLADDAIELFTDRARLAHSGFTLTADNAATVTEICRRLDGMPLAIELAAARVRALSLEEILDGLRDRFRLLTGGSRTAVRRQQTLSASVEWSHALLTEPERILFRRLAVFFGGFDLDAAEAVAGSGEVERYQVLDQLTLLVDKSLAVAESISGATRYRLLETMRQYAQEKLGESGEADAVRARHRDYYTALALRLDDHAQSRKKELLEQAEREMDNLRAAFAWSRDTSDAGRALQIASALQPIWVTRGWIGEGLSWLDAALADAQRSDCEIAPAVWARALADRAWIDAAIGTGRADEAEQAVAMARELDDPALLARALIACGGVYGFKPELAGPFFAEGVELARSVDDGWLVGYVLGWQSVGAVMVGYPAVALDFAREGRALSDSIGDYFVSRFCRYVVAQALLIAGDVTEAVAESRALIVDARSAHDLLAKCNATMVCAIGLAVLGRRDEALAVVAAAVDAGALIGGAQRGQAYLASGIAALVDGDSGAALEDLLTFWDYVEDKPDSAAVGRAWIGQAALACGDIAAARQWADDAVAVTAGWHQSIALLTRARVALSEGASQHCERDVYAALANMAAGGAYLGLPDILESIALLAGRAGSHLHAGRLLGAANAVRQRTGEVRFKVYEADCEESEAKVREAMGEEGFAAAWTEGAAMTRDEAIAYVQRGRGERRRAVTGWDSLTPTERDVVRLVSEGLGNKEIGARLFISHRTVQTHLTHVYTKLGITSRMQLAQESARRADWNGPPMR